MNQSPANQISDDESSFSAVLPPGSSLTTVRPGTGGKSSVLVRTDASHPAVGLSHIEVEAYLRGDIMFPGEPVDIYPHERAALWASEFAHGKWHEKMMGTPLNIVMLGGGIFVLGFLSTAVGAFWMQVLHLPIRENLEPFLWALPSMAVASCLAWGYRRTAYTWKGVREMVKQKRETEWMKGLSNQVSRMAENGLTVPTALREINDAIRLRRDNPSEVIHKLGVCDTVALMRIAEKLESAPLLQASRVVLEGETDELLARAVEALGGTHRAG